MTRAARALFTASALLLGAASLPAAPAVRVFLSVDMEGIAGVVTGDQLGPAGFEYQRFREFMT
ncbi:MAG TPA: M55 family metallopeptidase, partial [Thermoanaerobaculia bacterium]